MPDIGIETDDYLVLLGHPPASDFLRLVRTQAARGEELDAADLVAQWRESCARIRALEEERESDSTEPAVSELPPELAAAADACLQLPPLREIQRISPGRWRMVELDRLIVLQKYVNLRWAAQIEARIGKSPTGRDLMNIVSGSQAPPPEVRVSRTDENTFLLTCDSPELRLLGSRVLDPSAVANERVTGMTTHVIGMLVGFGSNCLSAVQLGGRPILTNGTHRAFALRKRGITRAPCLIAEVAHPEDLELIGVGESRARIERCARTARPAMLKDFFDPVLGRTYTLTRSKRVIQIELIQRALRVPISS